MAEPMAYLEEQALHAAALNYARSQFQLAETRKRVDRALLVLRLLAEKGDQTDRLFQRDELRDAEELAWMTLLHAGEKSWSDAELLDKPPERTKMEELVELIRKEVHSVRGKYLHPSQLEDAVFRAFDRVTRLVEQGGCTRSLGSEEPCARDGDCPVHGKHRPGQCVPLGEGLQASGFGLRVENPDPAASSPQPLSIPAPTHICRRCDKVFHQPFLCCGGAADRLRPEQESLDGFTERFDPRGSR